MVGRKAELPHVGRACSNTETKAKRGNLVYVRYKDHVLFRNSKKTLFQPSLRETVGWLVKENDEAVWVLWDRSLSTLPHERTRSSESGLVILKSEVLEMRKLG